MGYYVMTLIAFPVTVKLNENDGDMRALAKVHREHLALKLECEAIALHFLDDMAAGTCIHNSSKGACASFAAIGNYVVADRVAIDLLPFFDELWEHDLLSEYSNVLIFTEPEQRDSMDILQISPPGTDVVRTSVTATPLPFHWSI